MIKDLAEIELTISVVYTAMVVISTMEPIERALADRVPQMTTGIIWAIAGAAVWIIAQQMERYLKKTKK